MYNFLKNYILYVVINIYYFHIHRYLPDSELQKRCPTKYKELSSIFVSADGYCTRTHSILLVNGNNELTFVEETLMPDLTWKRQIFNNKLM